MQRTESHSTSLSSLLFFPTQFHFHGLLPPLTMAIMRSFFFNSFLYLSLLLFHLGCFFFPTNDRASNKKRKVVVSDHKPHNNLKRLSSSWSFFKRIFSSSSNTQNKDHETLTLALASARSSQHSIVSVVTPADTILSTSTPTRKRRNRSISISSEPDISIDQPSFPLRNDIFPCPTCGEIFQKTQLLEQHQVNKHAVSELFDGDSGKNIVQIIFKSGWNDSGKKNSPEIHRILKIHNSPKILSRFEEYRESVKAKASRLIGARKLDERCIADGNELLRFHCTTFMCNLGQNGNSSLCAQQYCSVCGIIRCGFSAKVDGISTLSNSLRAHVALPDELEQEFGFMNVKRAMLICRVVAGRIGNDQVLADKEDVGFDSVVGRGGDGAHARSDDDELLVFNPRAVLPCFAIVYSVPE